MLKGLPGIVRIVDRQARGVGIYWVEIMVKVEILSYRVDPFLLSCSGF
jgi:hypothetical protein